MNTAKRRVSPRAPSVALEEAINRTLRIYEAEGTHATSVEVALGHMGYKGKNGAALQALASLGYWGLVERPNGAVKVTKAVEEYKFTPDAEQKRTLAINFLRSPKLFSQLLEKYRDRLPSDGTLQYDLIQAGFTPAAAMTCLTVFRRSVAYVGYFDRPAVNGEAVQGYADKDNDNDLMQLDAAAVPAQQSGANVERAVQPERGSANASVDEDVDRIPIRLAGGRRAWLEIPSPFYTADRERLKKHIDLLLTDDEDNDLGD